MNDNKHDMVGYFLNCSLAISEKTQDFFSIMGPENSGSLQALGGERFTNLIGLLFLIISVQCLFSTKLRLVVDSGTATRRGCPCRLFSKFPFGFFGDHQLLFH